MLIVFTNKSKSYMLLLMHIIKKKIIKRVKIDSNHKIYSDSQNLVF